MVSQRKIDANRANSRKSTGPKTATGRAQASKNAHRHGLGIPVLAHPVLAAQVEEMARRIAGGAAAPHLLDLARNIAEAEVDILRIRRIRATMEEDRAPRGFDVKRAINDLNAIGSLIDQRATAGPDADIEWLKGVQQQVRAITTGIRQPEYRSGPANLERYERRAISRRKFAIRAFDKARVKSPENANTKLPPIWQNEAKLGTTSETSELNPGEIAPARESAHANQLP